MYWDGNEFMGSRGDLYRDQHFVPGQVLVKLSDKVDSDELRELRTCGGFECGHSAGVCARLNSFLRDVGCREIKPAYELPAGLETSDLEGTLARSFVLYFGGDVPGSQQDFFTALKDSGWFSEVKANRTFTLW